MEYYTKEEVDQLLARTRAEAVEEALRTLPLVVKNLVVNVSQLKAKSEQFYTEHKDLVQHKELVQKVMERVETKNPGATIDTILSKTAEETRSRLKSKDFDLGINSKPSEDTLNEGLQNILGSIE